MLRAEKYVINPENWSTPLFEIYGRPERENHIAAEEATWQYDVEAKKC